MAKSVCGSTARKYRAAPTSVRLRDIFVWSLKARRSSSKSSGFASCHKRRESKLGRHSATTMHKERRSVGKAKLHVFARKLNRECADRLVQGCLLLCVVRLFAAS